MTIQRIGPNALSLGFADGTKVLISYESVVAAIFPSGSAWKTQDYYSDTTGRHIGRFLKGKKAAAVDAGWLCALVDWPRPHMTDEEIEISDAGMLNL